MTSPPSSGCSSRCILGRKSSYWFNLSGQVARLEALARLGDSTAIEEEAATLLEYRRTYVEPFAQRALGQARGDRSLIEQALARFEELGLGWHAEQTRALLTA